MTTWEEQQKKMRQQLKDEVESEIDNHDELWCAYAETGSMDEGVSFEDFCEGRLI